MTAPSARGRSRSGDEIRSPAGPYEHTVAVRALSGRRGPAAEAAGLYLESGEPVEAAGGAVHPAQVLHAAFGPDKGRPRSKKRPTRHQR